jgi:hypothetical protein
MSLRRLLIAAAALVMTASALPAQTIGPPQSARVVGTVLDSSSGRPIVRSWICLDLAANPGLGALICTSPDTTGRYVLDGLPEGRQVVRIVCSGWSLFGGPALRIDTLEVGAGLEGRLDVSTDAASCDMRPYHIVRGLFRGHYSGGYESRFRACGDSVVASVRFARDALDNAPQWPKPNYRPLYVEWEGTLRGPWDNSQGQDPPYEFRVERVRLVRHSRDSDCA